MIILSWLKQRLTQAVCVHTFGPWHIATRVLYSLPFGTTRDEVQRRECAQCGFTQQQELERVRD